ncbi:YceD family protein [Acetobacterium tundrae]|uniref:DUF177 domain-containing protein n=1 Tax=Acetobacterium tundrae TaxID=132932 RepID=A0ABR6WJ71_9FIRM|nr:DUF177 domain-containing protein [Acetobacterium tundrae]MBC3796547.1 DUF177 domain-containing protein [Acetobacterium tundrae]
MNFEINKLLQEEIIPFEFVVKNTDFNEIEGKLDENGGLIRGTIEKISRGTFLVSFTIEMTMIYPCARCLEPTPIACCYEYSDTVTVEDGVTTLDLLPIVEECIYINEPYRVLCREDCAGLCPKCGNNLNHKQCECEKSDDLDLRFEALKKLL